LWINLVAAIVLAPLGYWWRLGWLSPTNAGSRRFCRPRRCAGNADLVARGALVVGARADAPNGAALER
jgi:hypothetical protein